MGYKMEEVGCSFYATYRYFIKLISNALLSSLKINLALPIITKYLYCYLMSFVKFWGRFAWTIFRSIDQNNGFIENTNSGNHWSDNKVFIIMHGRIGCFFYKFCVIRWLTKTVIYALLYMHTICILTVFELWKKDSER